MVFKTVVLNLEGNLAGLSNAPSNCGHLSSKMVSALLSHDEISGLNPDGDAPVTQL